MRRSSGTGCRYPVGPAQVPIRLARIRRGHPGVGQDITARWPASSAPDRGRGSARLRRLQRVPASKYSRKLPVPGGSTRSHPRWISPSQPCCYARWPVSAAHPESDISPAGQIPQQRQQGERDGDLAASESTLRAQDGLAWFTRYVTVLGCTVMPPAVRASCDSPASRPPVPRPRGGGIALIIGGAQTCSTNSVARLGSALVNAASATSRYGSRRGLRAGQLEHPVSGSACRWLRRNLPVPTLFPHRKSAPRGQAVS